MPTRRTFIKQSLVAAGAGAFHPKAAQIMAATDCNGTVVLAQPQVRVLFSGLLAYRFRPGPIAGSFQYCDIDPLKLLPTDEPHLFSVIVTEREGDNTPYMLWRYFGDPAVKRLDRLTLTVDKPMTSGVIKYLHNPFNRSLNTNDCSDWRWLLSLEELFPATPRPYLRDNAFWNGMQVTNGIFYTAIKTDRDRAMLSHECGVRSSPIYSVASVLAANIYLNDDATATLRGPDGDIPMRNRPNVAYEVYFD